MSAHRKLSEDTSLNKREIPRVFQEPSWCLQNGLSLQVEPHILPRKPKSRAGVEISKSVGREEALNLTTTKNEQRSVSSKLGTVLLPVGEKLTPSATTPLTQTCQTIGFGALGPQNPRLHLVLWLRVSQTFETIWFGENCLGTLQRPLGGP